MTIRIIINGAFGKMGQATVAAMTNESDLQLVGTAGRNDDLSAMIKNHRADVVIDWTLPSVVFDNAQKIIDAGARPVIGTTGLSPDEIKKLSDHCASKKIGGVIAPNFSIGAILMMKYAQDAARYFSDVEIIEYHHPKKVDAPSGTAKKTAELIAQTKKQKNMSTPIDNNLKNKNSRGEFYHDIPIHAIRLPGVFANQTVLFGGQGETLQLAHHATDRNAMMPGLFLCCRKVMTLDHLVYGMEHVIDRIE
jgi:4-hydroxy-tetrahydrodipicolinate reductase